MTGDKTPDEKATELRQRAEAILQGQPQEFAKLPSEDLEAVFHELQVHQIELEMQNEELRQAQVELSQARDRFFELYDLAPVGYLTLDENGIIQQANLTLVALLGVERRKLIRQPLTRFILPADQDIYYLHQRKLVETGEPQTCELRLKRADGHFFHAHLEAVVAGQEEATECRMTINDISARVRAADQITAALREKEILLREIHHRVKNNLQVIIALMDFQTESTGSPIAQEAFQESKRRVFAMANIHERLYRSEDFAQVQMGAYLHDLVKDLQIIYGAMAIIPQIETHEITLNINQAVPCGMLTSELISNTCKHAFPDLPSHPGPKLVLKLETHPGGYDLTVRDNGVGLPAGFEIERVGTLGLRIVKMFLYQLRGEIEITAPEGGGAQFKVSFPEPAKKDHLL